VLDSSLTAAPGSSLVFVGNAAAGSGGGLCVASIMTGYAPSAASLRGAAVFRGNTAAIPGTGGAIFLQGLSSDQPATLLADAGPGAAGALFEGNSALGGGGVSATFFARVELRGTVFRGNVANEAGGAVMLQASSSLLMAGGVLGDNAGGGKGGAVAAFESAVIANTTTFANNSAWFQGGAISALTTSTVALAGCTLFNNTVSSFYDPNDPSAWAKQVGGGAVFAADAAVVTLSGATAVLGNYVRLGDGGGLFLRDAATLTATGGAIDGNKATGLGGGVATHHTAVVTLIGGVRLRGNSAGQGGGGLFAGGNAAALGDVELSGNRAAGSGGGVLMYGPASAQGRVNISGNTAGESGGGVFASGSMARLTVQLAGAVVAEGNEAGADGGAVYLEDRCRIATRSIASDPIRWQYRVP
jgi:predicted outer membrane repeat protein